MNYGRRFIKNTGVGQIIDESLERCPEREAIVFGGWRIKYSELGSLIYKTAHYMKSIGVKRGDRVAIVSRNCPEYIICELAALKLGAVAVKFNWRLKPDEMCYLLDLNEVSCVFMKPEHPECLEALNKHYEGRISFVSIAPQNGVSALYSLLEGVPDTPVETVVEPEAPAYHMHTSGTTGRPKCVVYSTERYLRQMETMLDTLEFPDGQVYQFISQLFHSACAGAFLTLATGGKLILMERFCVGEYVQSLVQERVRAIGVIPLILKGILDETENGDYDLSNLKVINYSTCPISPALLERALGRLNCRFYQSYGMTEMASTISALLPEDHLLKNGVYLDSVGRAMPGVELRIERPDGSECAVGETGEICCRGRGMMLEYYKHPEQTAAAIRNGMYHTKDVGFLNESGYLFLRGRKDSLIISGGENIYPEEVLNVLLKLPGIAEAAVYGVPDEKWGEHVKASIVLRPDAALTAETVMTFCRDNMPHYRMPREVEFLPALPKNATGKVLINELKSRSI